MLTPDITGSSYPYGRLNPSSTQHLIYYPDGEIRWQVKAIAPSKARDSFEVRQRERLEKLYQLGAAPSAAPSVTPGAAPSAAPVEPMGIRPGWGELARWTKFTPHARRTIKRSAGALQRRFGKERLAFVTLTIPGSTDRATKAIAVWSGWIMNRIQTWLTDNYTHGDGSKYVLGAVELQKRGMLHWHFLVACEESEQIAELEWKAIAFWYRLLKQLSKKVDCDLFRRCKGGSWKAKWNQIKERACRVEQVKKSAANYLSKYISKGSKNHINKKGVYPPSRWWTCSDDCRRVMKEETKSYLLPNLSEEQLNDEWMAFVYDALSVHMPWVVPYVNKWSGEQIGWIARGTDEQAEECTQLLIQVIESALEPERRRKEIEQRKRQSELFAAAKAADERETEYWAEELCNRFFGTYKRGYSTAKKHAAYWSMIETGYGHEEAIKLVGY